MYNLLKLNLARNSLRYIIREYDIKEIYLPYYLCNVIRKSVFQENCKHIFYHIDDNFLPQKEFQQTDYILYPNYFGICDKNVEFLCKKYPNLIIDNAHSFFSEPNGLACFNSARKFLPVLNGSYLWIKKSKISLKEDKDFFDIPKNEKEILNTENKFDNYDILSINKKVLQSIKNLDLIKIKKERILKFKKYHQLYCGQNLLKINPSEIKSPFCYPVLFKNTEIADKVAEKMENKGLTMYRYWDNLPKNYNEYKFYKRLIAIPLDY